MRTTHTRSVEREGERDEEGGERDLEERDEQGGKRDVEERDEEGGERDEEVEKEMKRGKEDDG